MMQVARSVVLQNLSNTADPAPSSPPTSAHATAPALAPAEKVPGEPLESISQTGVDWTHTVVCNLLPKDRRNNSEN